MPQFTTSSARWAALQSRNPKAASAFVYCVTTTKIYCRPTCPSRLARRANIVFHDTAAEAAAEGFRACKRCRPELRDGDGDPQKIAVEKACELVRKEQSDRGSEDGKWSVKALAAEVGLTESHFCRIFKKVMGITVGEFRACIAPGTVESSQAVYMDQTPGADMLQGPGASFPTSDRPAIFGDGDWQSSIDLDCPELEQEWHQFSGVHPSMALLGSSRIHFNFIDSDHSSPDPFSDSTNLDMMDDGFQFVDFGNLQSTRLLA